MTYVDVFVAAVPTDKRAAYLEHAQEAAAVFKEHGALRVTECWGSDVPDGKLTSFPIAVRKEPHETVVVGWIEWPSRPVREEGMRKAMSDPRMDPTRAPMPFDGKRMIFGGFEAILDK